MKLHIDIPLKPMQMKWTNELLNKAQYHVKNSHTKVGMTIDWAKLPISNSTAIDDGDIPPELLYYWASVAATVRAYAEANNKHACWYDIKNRQEYELNTYTLAELMCNTFLWENNNLELALVWCGKDEFNIFNTNMDFEGFIIPVDSGLAFVSSLSKSSYDLLSAYFE